ncbi:MAG TPA: TIR domain-containing protein [Ktedonosporobacter sp.]|jgi:hypothetical protein|nr:TIR domain-containing protein [Ktedonosporobacter sp.]
MSDTDDIRKVYDTLPDPLKLFLCYSREDEALRKQLERHLEPMRREGLIHVWCDREISAGKDFLQEIKLHLDTSDILLALVSPAFMSSNYCYDVELQRALDKRIFGELHIIPVIIKPVEWKNTSLGMLQALPLDGKPVTKWKPIDEGWQNVAQGVRKVAQELQRARPVFNPALAERYHTRGAALVESGYKDPFLLEEAVEAFKRAIRYDPNNTYTWSYMAEILIELKRYEEALLACERAIQIDPMEGALDIMDETILGIKVDALEGLGKIEEAQQLRDYLKLIVTVEPDENEWE